MFRTRPNGRTISARQRTRCWRARPRLETMESRTLLSTFLVDNTGDSGPGTLRQAILDANADPAPGTDAIVFGIPASTAPELNVPVPGFDPSTQDWTISLASPLPVINRSVSIDGYTQGHVGIPYFYPADISSASQFLSFTSTTVGGTFTLTTSAPLPVGTTIPIPYDATAGAVQAALQAIIGAGNVSVAGGPLNSAGVTITFQGAYQGVAIPDLTFDQQPDRRLSERPPQSRSSRARSAACRSRRRSSRPFPTRRQRPRETPPRCGS